MTDRRRPGRGRDESGAVLVVVVLLALAMFAASLGLVLTARSSLIAAQSSGRVLMSRASADGAVTVAMRQGLGVWSDSVPVGGLYRARVAVGTDSASIRWRRLAPEVWLLEASVERERFPVVASTRLVWGYDPLERVFEWPGVVSIGRAGEASVLGTLEAPSIEAERAATTDALRPTCDPVWDRWLAALAADSSASRDVVVGVVDSIGLGRRSLAELLELVPTITEGIVTPEPRELGGACAVDDATNWGDPLRPDRPCGRHHVVRAGRGALTLDGGVGQGVLIVDGPLELRRGARFHGVLVASGPVSIGQDALLEGLVVAGGGIRIEPTGSVRRSVCRSVVALAEARATLGAAVPLHGALRFGPR